MTTAFAIVASIALAQASAPSAPSGSGSAGSSRSRGGWSFGRRPADCPPLAGGGLPAAVPLLPPYYYSYGFAPSYAVSGFSIGAPVMPEVPPIVFDLPEPGVGPIDPFGRVAAFDPLAAPIPPPRAAPGPARRAADRDRAAERQLVGDRLVRAGDLKRAVQRYEESINADPTRAEPFVRIAQVEVLRGRYLQAANRLREAQTTEPGWLLNARDVQNLFGDPADFADAMNRLESYLQTHPEDRDAWLVLGAELYLTGRTQRAADIFLRLTDRQPDETLSAFLDASRAVE